MEGQKNKYFNLMKLLKNPEKHLTQDTYLAITCTAQWLLDANHSKRNNKISSGFGLLRVCNIFHRQ